MSEKQGEWHEPEPKLVQEFPEKENLKNQLLKEGLEEKDIDISINLAEYMRELDFLVFSDNVPIIFADFECQQNKDIRAFYAPATRRQKEYYIVYIPKMNESLEEARTHFFFDDNGGLTTQKTNKPISTQELLLQIATHEVRHRFQQKPGLKKTTKSAREHDSHAIEFTAVEAFHEGKTLEEIARLIKIEN